jgi:hypothetical protein
MMYGAGVSYNYADRLTLAVDYQCQDWTKTVFFDKEDVLRTRQRWALGVEYRHNPLGRGYIDRVCWRLGANYSTSYAMTSDIPEFGLSLGFGLPLRTVATMINLTVEYAHRGALKQEALSENSLRLVISAAISENWFFKRKL